VLIPDTQVQRAYREIRQRYASDAEFEEDLNRNGLTGVQLRQALRRELIFDAVMQRVGARHAPITETDERLFFELHRDRFTAPETRAARHILITINDDYPENSRTASRARIEAIAERLSAGADDPAALTQRFARLARKGSECPTAMEGGQLGTLGRGQLYPALDAALFTLEAGAVSGIVESELGFHLILCETIHAAKSPPFAKVRERIRQALEQRRRKDEQRRWLASLPA
jgi:peptidyl-prolyl cis-trans isomerase C